MVEIVQVKAHAAEDRALARPSRHFRMKFVGCTRMTQVHGADMPHVHVTDALAVVSTSNLTASMAGVYSRTKIYGEVGRNRCRYTDFRNSSRQRR
jgi:hypothetical protein